MREYKPSTIPHTFTQSHTNIQDIYDSISIVRADVSAITTPTSIFMDTTMDIKKVKRNQKTRLSITCVLLPLAGKPCWFACGGFATSVIVLLVVVVEWLEVVVQTLRGGWADSKLINW